MMKFEVGKTYTGRFISDSDSTFEFKVIKRTEKQISIVDAFTKESKKVGVKIGYEGNEVAYPFGKYSTCPMIKADRYL